MLDTSANKTRIYAPTEEMEYEGYPQLTNVDTCWTDEERNTMREHDYDGMDMLRAWLG